VRVGRAVSSYSSKEEETLAAANLVDYLADQMGEGKMKDGKSISERFRQIFSVIFDEVHDSSTLETNVMRKRDQLVLEQLQSLFKDGPKTSAEQVRQKFAFRMEQQPPETSLEIKWPVGVKFTQCNLVHALAALGFQKSLDFLLENRYLSIKRQRSKGTAFLSPLDTAVRFNHVKIAKMLVEKYGMDALEFFEEKTPNGVTLKEHSPLIRATADGRLETTQWCLQQGVDPNTTTEYVTRNLKEKYRATVLRTCIANGLNNYEETAIALIEAGADPNLGIFEQKTKDSKIVLETPLMTAAKMKKLRLLKALIDLSADINLKTETEGSVLSEAASVPDNTEVLEFILDVIDISPVDTDAHGQSALAVAKDACESDDCANFKLLHEAARENFRQQEDTNRRTITKTGSFCKSKTIVKVPIQPGDRVLLSVGYQKSKLAKALLSTGENFWAVVENVYRDSVDVVIDEVLALAHQELEGANFGDEIKSIPLDMIHDIQSSN